MAMPLDGIRVVDWTIFQQGPVASAMLGDMGAEVIKIEELGVGDPVRGISGIAGINATLPGGKSYNFEVNNRNKKSVAIDMKNPQAKAVLYRLVEQSDVFVQNFRQGVPERLGMGYDTLVNYNPKIIYASASGYGSEGPESHRPSLDPVGMARTGFLELFGSLESEEPRYCQGGIADQMGAVMLAYGIMGALVARERLGVGQKVDCSHMSSMMWLQSLYIHAYLLLGKKLPRFQQHKAANPMMNFYRCQDGKWLFLSLLQQDRHWGNFCQAIGRAEMENNPLFETADKRRENRGEMISIMDKIFATRTCDEWISVLQEFPDFIYERVNSVSDLPDDPQVVANDYIVDFSHPTIGDIKMINVPVTFSETPGGIRTAAPECGQDTEEVLTEICGYSWDDIAALRDAEVI